jgi:hypothetical protein
MLVYLFFNFVLVPFLNFSLFFVHGYRCSSLLVILKRNAFHNFFVEHAIFL